jgi:hypothetical protein
MVTGRTLADVIEIVGHDGSEKTEWSKHPEKHRGFTMGEINIFFALHGYTLGVVGADIGQFSVDFAERYDSISVDVPIDLPAMVLDESTLFDGVKHCLFWDGHRLYDPHHDGERKLMDYTLLEWWPVLKLNDHGFTSKARKKYLGQ